jgi:hypothetical protein
VFHVEHPLLKTLLPLYAAARISVSRLYADKLTLPGLLFLEVHMMRYHFKSPQPRPKPLTKAIASQHRSEALLRRFDMLYWVFIGLAGTALLVHCLASPPQAFATGAKVGDMINFNDGKFPVPALTVVLPALRVTGPRQIPGPNCALDIAHMARSGGGLAVQEVQPEGVVLSWAGTGTASGTADCGRNAEIRLSNAGFAELIALEKPPRPMAYR